MPRFNSSFLDLTQVSLSLQFPANDLLDGLR
jgi:hypothetical protein